MSDELKEELILKQAEEECGIVEAVKAFKKICESNGLDAKEELLAILDAA
jgi:hypothetical protein